MRELSHVVERSVLMANALERFAGNVSDAAKALGLSRSALYRRLEKYGLCSNVPESSAWPSRTPPPPE